MARWGERLNSRELNRREQEISDANDRYHREQLAKKEAAYRARLKEKQARKNR